MTITRKGLADEIEQIEMQIAALNEGKGDAYGAYRDQMKAEGMDPCEVKLELAAFKVAMRRRRRLQENAQALDELDVRTEEILAEIDKPTPAVSGARTCAKSSAGFETTDGAIAPAAGAGEEGAAAVHPAEVTASRADAPSEPEETSPPTAVSDVTAATVEAEGAGGPADAGEPAPPTNTIGTAIPPVAAADREGAAGALPPGGDPTPRRTPRRPRVPHVPREPMSKGEGAADKAPSPKGPHPLDIPDYLRREAAE